MRQRAMIAIALSCDPALLIADEPTTALDVTIQLQITELMRKLQREIGMAVIWITHDLGVIARLAERVLVMYAGYIVESAKVKDLYARTGHPYTIGLLRSIPSIDDKEGRTLVPIEGLPPNLINMPPTCAFLPRCAYRLEKCFHDPWPPLISISDGHYVSCYAKIKEI